MKKGKWRLLKHECRAKSAHGKNRAVARAWLQQSLALPNGAHDDAVQATIGPPLAAPYPSLSRRRVAQEQGITMEMLRRVQQRSRSEAVERQLSICQKKMESTASERDRVQSTALKLPLLNSTASEPSRLC